MRNTHANSDRKDGLFAFRHNTLDQSDGKLGIQNVDFANHMTTPSKPSKKRPKGAESRRKLILDAAEASIERYGLTKTTMEDVTEASGLGRMTVYRVFRTRSDLLNALAVRRMEFMSEQLAPQVSAFPTFEDAVVDGSLLSLDMTREDKLLFSLIEYTTDKSIERLLVDLGTPLEELMIKVWGDVFSKARQHNVLRNDVTNTDMINWLRSMHMVLHFRDDLDREGRAKLLKTFVIPSFVALNNQV